MDILEVDPRNEEACYQDLSPIFRWEVLDVEVRVMNPTGVMFNCNKILLLSGFGSMTIGSLEREEYEVSDWPTDHRQAHPPVHPE